MNERWNWLARYAVVIIVALILAAALGSTDLFNKTRLIGKTLLECGPRTLRQHFPTMTFGSSAKVNSVITISMRPTAPGARRRTR